MVAPTRTGPDGTIEPVSAEYPRAFQVNVSETPRPGSALDALNAADAAAKQGDAQAAYAMFVAIKRCQEPLLARDMRDLEAARSRPADYQRLLERNETTLRECAGVGPEEIARGYAGLMLAAERGDVLASLVYATTGSEAFSGSTTDMLSAPEKLIEYRQNAMRFLHAAADRGSVQAMQALANAYARGVITTRDPVKSYVYTYAEYLLAPADPLARRQADDAGSGLSAEQIGAAQGQARAMLERCCR
ncbi:MAG TPA: hypothetical protein VJ724_09590 [Tahibacter sp.]|nr:hypothetical protein [Tahibacter sp.]